MIGSGGTGAKECREYSLSFSSMTSSMTCHVSLFCLPDVCINSQLAREEAALVIVKHAMDAAPSFLHL